MLLEKDLFELGMNLDDFQTNFGRGQRDHIWAKVDLTKFQSRSTWQNFSRDRLDWIWLNFGQGRFCLIRPNFGQSRLGQIWPHLDQGLISQILVRVDSTKFVGRNQVDWIWPIFNHNRLSWI